MNILQLYWMSSSALILGYLRISHYDVNDLQRSGKILNGIYVLIGLWSVSPSQDILVLDQDMVGQLVGFRSQSRYFFYL
jgi:hypothetical protein